MFQAYMSYGGPNSVLVASESSAELCRASADKRARELMQTNGRQSAVITIQSGYSRITGPKIVANYVIRNFPIPA